jgi:hypothetical protein
VNTTGRTNDNRRSFDCASRIAQDDTILVGKKACAYYGNNYELHCDCDDSCLYDPGDELFYELVEA